MSFIAGAYPQGEIKTNMYILSLKINKILNPSLPLQFSSKDELFLQKKIQFFVYAIQNPPPHLDISVNLDFFYVFPLAKSFDLFVCGFSLLLYEWLCEQ